MLLLQRHDVLAEHGGKQAAATTVEQPTTIMLEHQGLCECSHLE
jgi:hypothetical protein